MATQQKLPGVGPKSIPEIEDKARELRKAQAARKTAAEKETTLRQELLDLLKKHGFRNNKPYQFEDETDGDRIELDVVIEQKEAKAYVRKHKDPNDKSGDEEETEEAAD